MRLTPQEMQDIFIPENRVYYQSYQKDRIRRLINIDGFNIAHRGDICFYNDIHQPKNQPNQPQNHSHNQPHIQSLIRQHYYLQNLYPDNDLPLNYNSNQQNCVINIVPSRSK